MFSGFVPSSIVNPASDGCVRETLTDGLDLIFTDIMGVLIIAERSGPDYSLHKFVFLRVICHRYYLTYSLHGVLTDLDRCTSVTFPETNDETNSLDH